MIETAVSHAPAGMPGKPTTAGLKSALVVAVAAVLFLLARGLVWARPVSLEDLDLLALGALPPLLYLAFGNGMDRERRCATLLAWGWAASLLAYIVLHVAHRFDGFEAPIRATFEPGLARYAAYGVIYSTVGVATALLVRRLFVQVGFSASSIGALAAGSAVNALYFGIALFMLPF